MRGGWRDINNSATHEWPAIIDGHDHGASIAVISDPHPCAKGQCAVSSGKFVGIELFATRGL
jgi:hypothetical protein